MGRKNNLKIGWQVLVILLVFQLTLTMKGDYRLNLGLEDVKARLVALQFAPIIYQDTDDDCQLCDYIRKFNYDGDWLAGNNWDNALKYNLKAYILLDFKNRHPLFHWLCITTYQLALEQAT